MQSPASRHPSSPSSFRRGSALALLMLCGMTACAGASQVAREPLRGDLREFDTAVLRVEERVDDDVTAEMASLHERVVAGLHKKQVFPALIDAGAVEASTAATDGAPLQVCATITGVRKVSGASRLLGGAFAGKARLTVIVDLLDANDQRLASYQIEGTSGSTGMSGGTDDAVASAAAGIVDLLAGLRRRS